MAFYDVDGNPISFSSGELADLSTYGDITTAEGFVNAFDSAMADDDISGISIPYGQYNVASPLQITRSGFVIDGNLATLSMRSDAGVPANCDCFRINGKNRITIRNLLINMRQNKNSPSGTAFYFLDATIVTVENVDVYQIGCRGALIYNTDETSETTGSNKIFFHNVKFRGIDQQNTVQSEWPCGIIAVNLRDSGFRDCVVTGMCRFTLEFKNYTKNCYMINNVIYGSSFTYQHESGIALGGDRPSEETILGDGIVAIGNIVRNCKYPLYLGRTVNSVFNDNVFEGQIFASGVQNSVFSGNVMQSTDKYAIPLIYMDGCSNLSFNGNIYDPGENDLLYMNQNTNILLDGFMDGREIHVLNPTSGTPSQLT